MAKVSMKSSLPATPDQVWQIVKGFNALPDWHPAIEKSELEDGGQVRKLSLAGGGMIVERLITSDDGNRLYSYSVEDSPLPVSNYTATIRVSEDDKGNAELEWSSEFDPAGGATDSQAMETISGIYQAGFDNLKKMLGN